jgi:hypothetical protein
MGVGRGPGGPALAIVLDELPQQGQQVPRVVDQHPVQALPTDSAYPPFRVRVRPRLSRWAPQNLDAFAGEHLIEHLGIAAVPVADQERELPVPLPQLQHEVAGLLRHPRPGRMDGHAEDVHSPGADLHQENT